MENTGSRIRKIPVRRRITAMVIFISVVPILIISIYTYYRAYRSVQSTAMEYGSEILTYVQNNLNDLFSAGSADAKTPDTGQLKEKLKAFGESSSNILILTDPEGNLISRNSLTIPAKAVSDKIIHDYLSKPSEGIRAFLNDNTFFACSCSLQQPGWLLILLSPYGELMKPLQMIFFVALFLTLFVLNFSITVIDSIDGPMAALVRSFGNAARNDFEVGPEETEKDELGILTSAFHEICAEMRETLKKVETEQDLKRSAEIKMLQAQINPHFLFNTLDSLRFTSMMSNVPTVSDGLSALSHLLRNSILNDDHHISLMKELQNVEDYLLIQKIRSCEIIQLEKNIEPGTENACIMKLLLQPIVENSVIHGMKENEPLHIQIRTARSGEMLSVILTDDGKGFDINAENSTKNSVAKGSHMSGIGLKNVRDRLYLEYKEMQSFTIESEPGKGTRITITVPFAEAEVRQ